MNIGALVLGILAIVGGLLELRFSSVSNETPSYRAGLMMLLPLLPRRWGRRALTVLTGVALVVLGLGLVFISFPV